ncbi:WXG100 family type VII secretion target [Nocardia mexicana]|nr:WXG100 family type VII secretion target [Nocardia mexicana]
MEQDDAAISSAAQKVMNSIEQIRSQVNAVTAKAQEMKAGWEGDAYVAFSGVADSWQQEGLKLNAKIDAMREHLQTVVKQTNAAQSDSSSNIARLNMGS